MEEGAAVLGLREEAVWDSRVYHNHLFGVGRDGETVTLIEWQSDWSAPPVDYFKNTSRRGESRPSTFSGSPPGRRRPDRAESGGHAYASLRGTAGCR
ncbi:hypothetical protein [Streptomyces sp. NPDC085529]|uniref:hypothetical protein n=1 Tax=Streptomyces sp. NPDC085529 TaxID=3365729 RepID=UPI0037D5B109